MADKTVNIIEFDNTIHRKQVTGIWQKVFGYETAHNSPELVIDKKIETKDGLFLVAEKNKIVLGTVMGGYDGHRGWIYSLAVLPEYQKLGIGSLLLAKVQEKLTDLGCVKINLQILAENEAVKEFYLANGFAVEARVSMGKKV